MMHDSKPEDRNAACGMKCGGCLRLRVLDPCSGPATACSPISSNLDSILTFCSRLALVTAHNLHCPMSFYPRALSFLTFVTRVFSCLRCRFLYFFADDLRVFQFLSTSTYLLRLVSLFSTMARAQENPPARWVFRAKRGSEPLPAAGVKIFEQYLVRGD